MSIEQHAFLTRDKVPSPAAWQNAIDKLGYSLTIDQNISPFDFSGHLPCKLDDRDSGFEITYETDADMLENYPEIAPEIAGRDAVISFRVGHDMAECVCMLIASAALLQSFDALIFDPQENVFSSFEDIMSELSAAVAYNEELSADEEIPAPQKQWWQFWK